MRAYYSGGLTKLNIRNPRAIARCDYSGFMVRHMDLVRQMTYRGTGLVWTGFMVHPNFVDEPNPQDLVPLLRQDPVPVQQARPDSQIDAQNSIASTTGVITIEVTGDTTLTAKQFNNGSITFTGVLTNDVVISVPALYNQFYANNITTGGFNLWMQLELNTFTAINIPQADPQTKFGPTVVNTSFNLQIVYF